VSSSPRHRCSSRRQHGDEDLRWADLAADPVDDRHRLAGVVDEHLVAGDMVLAHRRRQPALEIAVKLAEAAIAIPARMRRAVLLP
jgi:hypothetical protein